MLLSMAQFLGCTDLGLNPETPRLGAWVHLGQTTAGSVYPSLKRHLDLYRWLSPEHLGLLGKQELFLQKK